MPTGIYPRTLKPRPDPRPRFFTFVEKQPDDGCWLWTGTAAKGYGRFWWNGAQVPAHRVAYILFVGELSSEDLVLHRCDTPLCVRPDHLWKGTQSDNIKDAVAKGRWTQAAKPKLGLRGAGNNRTKLTEDQVREIRVLYERGEAPTNSPVSLRGLAKRFGVSKYAIYSIVHRLTWDHLSDSVTVVRDPPD